MNQDVANREAQTWSAAAVAIEGELQHQQQELRQALQWSEKPHLADLFELAVRNSAQLKAELKRLTEQNQYLKQELCAANKLLVEYRQELDYTNQELNDALNMGSLSVTDARQLAKRLLNREESARDALAVMLSAIYRTPIKPWELQPTSPITQVPVQDRNGSAAKLPALSDKAAQFKERYESLAARFAALKAQRTRLEGKLNLTAAKRQPASLTSSQTKQGAIAQN